MITTVLVPVDGSPRGASALAPARALAERTGATLLLLTTAFDAEPDADETPDTDEAPDTDGEEA